MPLTSAILQVCFPIPLTVPPKCSRLFLPPTPPTQQTRTRCPNQITYTKLLRLLPWPTALALLFGHAPMGAVAFGAAVAACGAQNAWRAAVALLGAMPGPSHKKASHLCEQDRERGREI